MACWTEAREEDSGGFWPSHAAVAAQGQADASEVTAMRALGWRQKPAGHSSKEQLCWGTLDPGFCCTWASPSLWLGDAGPVSRLESDLAA